MKNIFALALSTLLLIGFSSCEKEEELTFTASNDADGLSFTNDFLAEYLLSDETSSNVAERFVWEPADFDAPVNITYELEASTDPTFETFETIGTTAETNISITVGQLLDFANDLELDSDPETTTEDGLANNTGQVYFRLYAYTGTGAANAIETYSEVQPITITLIEEEAAGAGCDPLWALGDALTDALWDWNNAVELTCENDILTARVALTNGNFRFFPVNGSWDSSYGYYYFADDGYTIDANLEGSGDGDDNFTFVGTPGIYELVINHSEQTITLTASEPYYMLGDGVPAALWDFANAIELVETSPYIRTATTEFANNNFRLFGTSGDWTSGMGYYYFADMGYTIDPLLEPAEDADDNFYFAGTPGTYTITINESEQTITME